MRAAGIVGTAQAVGIVVGGAVAGMVEVAGIVGTAQAVGTAAVVGGIPGAQVARIA